MSALADLVPRVRDDIDEWCQGKSVAARAALLAYLVYAGVRHMFDPTYRSWFGGITLIFHEMGHLIFAGLGRTMTILGGSITQLVVPVLAGAYLLVRQRDYFGLSVCSCWLSFSIWDLATYVGDARREALPLVGFGDHPEHDWSKLLTQWHVLNDAESYATALRVVAFGCWALSVALGLWICYRIWRASA